MPAGKLPLSPGSIRHRVRDSTAAGRAGAVILVVARDEARGSKAAAALCAQGLQAAALRLDVTDGAAIGRTAIQIEEQYGRLDTLVNNAGISWPLQGRSHRGDSQSDAGGLRQQCVRVVAVTNEMLPLLRRPAAGRIVNMSSGLGSLTLNSDPGWSRDLQRHRVSPLRRP